MAEQTLKSTPIRYIIMRRLGRFFIYSVLILGAFISIVPFIWMISASLMTRSEALSSQLS
jgi:ABC-type glycerol-3-phosphate transport system permease component